MIGKRMCEDMAAAEAFESDFPKVTGRTVEIIGGDDPPDVIALIDGVETGVELTAIMCANAEDIMLEMPAAGSDRAPRVLSLERGPAPNGPVAGAGPRRRSARPVSPMPDRASPRVCRR